MKLGIDRVGTLVSLLNSLYEEYRDDLPPTLRLPINFVRQLCAKATKEQLNDIRTATKADIDKALLQAKLGTEYAALSWLNSDTILSLLKDVIPEQFQAIRENLDRLHQKIDDLPRQIPVVVVDHEIEAAKTLLQDGHADIALHDFERMKRSWWGNLDGWRRYRIEANIGTVKEYEGDLEAAARHYLEAYQWAPNEEKARCFRAVGYSYLGEQEKAHKLISAVFQDHPESTFAAQVWIRTAPSSMDFREIEQHIPGHLRQDGGVAIGLARRALVAKLLDIAEHYGRLAYDAADDDIGILQELAVILIERETPSRKIIRATEPVIDASGKLTEAITLLTRAISKLGSRGPIKRAADLRHNRALIYQLLGNDHGARADLEVAHDSDPENHGIAILLARYHIEKEENDRAIEVLECIVNKKHSPRSVLGLTAALFNRDSAGDRERARTELERCHKGRSKPLTEGDAKVAARLIELCVAEDRGADARRVLEEVQGDLSPVMLAVVSAKAYHRLRDGERANDYAKQALGHIDENSEWDDVFIVADLLFELELHKEAFPLWKRIVPPDCLGPLVFRLLECARRTREYEFIRDYCRDLRENGYLHEDCFRLELDVLQEFNSLSDAIETMRGTISREPENPLVPEIRLWLSLTGLRLGRQDLVTSDPADLPAVGEVTPQSGRTVVFVLHSGNREAAVEYAYRLYRRYPSKETSFQTVLYSTVLGGPYRFMSFDTVLPDTAVCCEYKETGQQVWRIMESEIDPEPDTSRNELALDDDIAKRLMGAKRGDTVTLRDDPLGPIEVEIRDIIDKYLYRSRRCFEDFETEFPGSRFLRGFRVIDEKTGEPDFSAVVAVLKAQEGQMKRAEQFYREQPLCPLSKVAQIAGTSIVEVVHRTAAAKDVGLRCCVGSVVERQQALRALQLADSVVVDWSVLAGLFIFGQVDLLEKVPLHVVISEGTVADLNEFRETYFRRPDERQRLTLVGDQPAVDEWSEKEWERLRGLLDQLLVTIHNRCEVGAGFGVAGLEADTRDEMDNIFGRSVAETIELTNRPGHVLWSDDQAVAVYGRARFKIERVWTQSMCFWLAGAGCIAADKAHEITLCLLGANYQFTGINVAAFGYALHKGDWKVDEWPVRVVLDHFRDEHVNVPHIYPLMVDVLQYVWNNSPNLASSEGITLRLLERISRRSGGDVILGQLGRNLSEIFGLNVVAEFRVREAIRAVTSSTRTIVLPSPLDILRFRGPLR